MNTIEFSFRDGGVILLLDQRALPDEKTILTVTDHQQLIEAIQTLAIRGAPALGVAGALGVALIAIRSEQHGWSEEARDQAINALRVARPTAVNLAWGVDKVLPALKKGSREVLEVALAISESDGQANRAMGSKGADYLVGLFGARKLRILTHCNTGALATTQWGTALGVVRELHTRGFIEEVYADETRPLLQGSRLTAWELNELKIPYRILPDGAAASLLLSGVVDVVLIGADRIARNGDSANKIGSLGVAIAAKEAEVPFLVVAPESTIDRSLASGNEIEIEFRSDNEVTQFAGKIVAPSGSRTYNPAFDVTPAKFIKAIVTEREVYEVGSGTTL
jgi:methylthioribose-1-phosphate isomerase